MNDRVGLCVSCWEPRSDLCTRPRCALFPVPVGQVTARGTAQVPVSDVPSSLVRGLLDADGPFLRLA